MLPKRAIVFALIAFLTAAFAATAQERARTDVRSQAAPCQVRDFRLSLYPVELLGGSRLGGMRWYSESGQIPAGEELFTSEMLKEAMIPDPNRNIPWYRSDPRYYRITEVSIRPREAPSSLLESVVGDLNWRSLLSDALRGLAIRFREDLAYGKRGPQDYFALPNNTGQLRTFGDAREEAQRRGDAQSYEVHGGENPNRRLSLYR